MAPSPCVKSTCYPATRRRMSRTIAVLYRLLYAGLLSRLPESAAISLGQGLLRRLPLDRLGCFRLSAPPLPIPPGGGRLPNPIVLAAMYYDPALPSRARGLGFGPATPKTITVQAA